jgi:tetratricopeptide (TPR) repeat protein
MPVWKPGDFDATMRTVAAEVGRLAVHRAGGLAIRRRLTTVVSKPVGNLPHESRRSPCCYNLTVPPRLATTLFLALALARPLWGQTPAAAGEREAAQLRAAAEHLRQGKAEQAVRECRAALASDPRSAPAHMLLGQAYLAQGSTSMLAEAKAELQQALDLDPNLLWARFYLARIYLDQGLNQKAREQLERGLKERPNVPHFLSLLGEARRKLGDPAASVELNRKALQIDATMTPAHYYLALAYLDLKQEDSAMGELESSIHSQFVTPEMYVALAALYGKRQRFAEAEDLCRKAIALDASRPEAYLSLARLYNAQHASDKALQALRLVLPDGKEFPASAFYQGLQADICIEQGTAYQAKGMAAQAIEAYARALGFDPSRGGVHRRLAELYLRGGDSARAIEHATAAEKLGTPIEAPLRGEIFK